MSAKTMQEIQRQQEANAIEIQRLKMRQAGEAARREQPPKEEFYQAPQITEEVEYAEVDLDQVAMKAANLAADKVVKHMQNYNEVGDMVKKRMNRLVEEYPALTDEGSLLVLRAREEYQRISTENPTLDEATKYELSVKSAAAAIGARPVNAPFDPNQDFTMPTNSNPALSRPRKGKSRLTPNILANAKIMGINVDPNTPEGKKNLEELEESTVRFNADADETMYKYR